MTRPYPRPWRVGFGSINFIPRGSRSRSGSIFHYKGLGLDLGVTRGFGSVYTPSEHGLYEFHWQVGWTINSQSRVKGLKGDPQSPSSTNDYNFPLRAIQNVLPAQYGELLGIIEGYVVDSPLLA
ncbi:hypothetical protein M9H77_29836 [Catharanthus roseus]|uniref:Uncharacterized protein n=1 Tax=Catharanthus roseus TaxID=4058 RepID=A0ACB9ZXH9_CATRO|nr:hypothetical protein M9H77_29836 [Catharanthus roseus]